MANRDYYSISKLDLSTGVMSLIAGSGTTEGGVGENVDATMSYMTPYDVAVSSVGEVYASYSSNNRIRKVSFIIIPCYSFYFKV